MRPAVKMLIVARSGSNPKTPDLVLAPGSSGAAKRPRRRSGWTSLDSACAGSIPKPKLPAPPQLPSKVPQIPTTRDHKAVHTGGVLVCPLCLVGTRWDKDTAGHGQDELAHGRRGGHPNLRQRPAQILRAPTLPPSCILTFLSSRLMK